MFCLPAADVLQESYIQIFKIDAYSLIVVTLSIIVVIVDRTVIIHFSGFFTVVFLNATTPIARLLFDLCYLTFITTVAPAVALLYQLLPAAIALMLSLYLPFFSFFLTVIFPVFVSTLKYFLNLAFFTPVS